MTATIKSTDKYELFHGMMAGYAVVRKSDNKTTNWNTGLDGIRWKNSLVEMSDDEFNEACSKETYS
jgi:hypothetical protein